MNDSIVCGDHVDVHFTTAPSIYHAEVLYVPCSDNDAFHLKSISGELIYVQQYAAMYVRE